MFDLLPFQSIAVLRIGLSQCVKFAPINKIK